MKNFDWKTFLKRHSIFSRLKDVDIEQILKDEVSEERDCLQGSVIIREGEFSDSVFLIGTGSVQVVLQGKDGYEINISTLGKGEFFGEIATFGEMPRSATIITQEKSTLLEAEGKEFSKIIEEHPDIAFRVFSKLSERLRSVSGHFLSAKLKDVDEKFNLFNAKLDAELKAVDASLNAAQVVFDQTKEKSEQVIINAEKSWTHLKKIASALGILITVVISIFAWFGINKYQDISKKFGEKLEAITKIEKEIKGKAENIIESEKKLGQAVYDLKFINEVKEVSLNVYFTMLDWAILEKDEQRIKESYEQLLRTVDPYVISRLLGVIEMQMLEEKDRKIYKDLLAKSIDYIDTPGEKITAYYLQLAVLILDNKHKETEFEEILSDFKKYVGTHGSQRIKENQDFSMIEAFIEDQDKDKQDMWFKHVKPLIP